MKLLTLLKDLPAHTLTGSPQVKISHLECDSRRVLPGSAHLIACRGNAGGVFGRNVFYG